MDLFDVIILGILEGLTEFLPVSSTGHLLIMEQLLGLAGEKESAFAVIIQLGAILAVVVLYAQRFKMLFQKGNGAEFSGMRGWLLLGITSFPILSLGYLLKDFIKGVLFGNTWVIAGALGLGGLALILLERLSYKSQTRSLDELTYKQAFSIGLFQCLAMCPGMSRSASTIIGGLFSGLERTVAAEYSFIAAVPVMCAVTIYDMLSIWDQLSAEELKLFAIGFIIAFVSAILGIKTLVSMLQRWTLAPFGVYRIIISLFIIWKLT